MKETIKAFLDEFLAIGTYEGYGVEEKIFAKLFTLGDDFVFWNPRSDIRMWQKSIDDDELDWGGGRYFYDYMQIYGSDISTRRYRLFFEHCPEAKELFELDEEKNIVQYNPALSAEEKREIAAYIGSKYKIVIQKNIAPE